MNTNPILFRQGEENGIVIERDHFDRSIFVSQYQQSITIFNGLWKLQDKMLSAQETSHLHPDFGMDNQFSNIIAYCGDRGEGKSSCMSSFVTMLVDKSAREDARSVFADLDKIADPKYIDLLEIIDPAFFDNEHNLLELLLGRVYGKISKGMYRDADRDMHDAYLHRSLMEQFQKVRKSLSLMEKKEKIYESIEELSDLSVGVSLRTDIHEIFKQYLQYSGKKRLLICIDDIDLNTRDGYRMSEMLRKYLVCPYCIVLVAVKVDQLIDIIANAHQEVTKLSASKCQQMAQKYVTKLLPQGNRIAMPLADDFYDRELQIVDIDGNSEESEHHFSVKEKVVQMIFQKTGYVFYNTQYLSPIVPTNLRSLRHLLGLLYTLPDARDENWDDNETGREAFKDYFFNTWSTRLSEKDYSFAQQLAEYSDVTTLNAFVVEYFAKRVIEEGIEIAATDVKDEFAKLYSKITSDKNTAINISYGDVMYILWLIHGISLNTDLQNLIFFIKTVYSMRLYACYNIISRGKEDLYPLTLDVEKMVSIHRADTLYEHVNQLQKLVNGSYFTYPQGTLLPKNEEKNDYRDRKPIPFDNIIKCLKKLKADYDNDEVRETDAFRIELALMEILVLCITRTTNEKEQQEDKGNNRTEKVPTYLGVLSSTANYAIFDFLHPFYSLCNIKYTYGRFDDIITEKGEKRFSFYDIARRTEGSLLEKLLAMDKKHKDEWKQEHYLISDAVIRVTDVQWAIYDELLRTRDIHKNGDDSLLNAYEDIVNLRIKLYPLRRQDKGGMKAHVLKFEFLHVLAQHIREIGWDSLNNMLYIPQTDPIRQELNAFSQRLLKEIILMPNQLIPGVNIRRMIRNISGLSEREQRSLSLKLRNVFETGEHYSKQYVQQHIDDILSAYAYVKFR